MFMYDIHGKYINRSNTPAVSAVREQRGGNGKSTKSSIDIPTSSESPWKSLMVTTNKDNIRGLATRDFPGINQYMLGQSINGTTRINAPSDKDIEFSINNDTKMMMNAQGKVYINTDDHSAQFQEQMNINGNILTNSAFIGSQNSTDSTMLIGNAHQMSNKDTRLNNFSLAHTQDGTTMINSKKSLQFTVNGDTKLLIDNNSININDPVTYTKDVKFDGNVEVMGTLTANNLQTSSLIARLSNLEDKLIQMTITLDKLVSDKQLSDRLSQLESHIANITDMNVKLNALIKNNRHVTDDVKSVQKNIKYMNGKLESVVDASNIKDVNSIYEELRAMKSHYTKLNMDIHKIMST